jgi:hypothetical protein
VSWTFIEEPVRHGAIGRWVAQLRSGAWHAAARRGWATVGIVSWVVALAAAALAGAVPAASAGSSVAAATAAGQGAQQQARTAGLDTGSTRVRAAAAAAVSLKTSCRSVVHFGDSTSDGLVSADYLPNPALRISAQYADVGVRRVRFEIQGGTSIVETILGEPNAYTLARGLVQHGYHGCWVLALGTNDTADVAVGSNVGLAARIQRMMTVIRGQPVMWVNVRSLLKSGPYAEKNMQEWNRALLHACRRYPNMRVYNWAGHTRRAWFISDGIHYTSAGYAQRSALIAGALAAAFPSRASLDQLPWLTRATLAVSSPTNCLVN